MLKMELWRVTMNVITISPHASLNKSRCIFPVISIFFKNYKKSLYNITYVNKHIMREDGFFQLSISSGEQDKPAVKIWYGYSVLNFNFLI